MFRLIQCAKCFMKMAACFRLYGVAGSAKTMLHWKKYSNFQSELKEQMISFLNCIEHARLKVISVGFGCLQRCFFKVICLLRHRDDAVHCPESIFRSEFKNAQLLTIENINWTVINLKEVFVCTVVCGIC